MRLPDAASIAAIGRRYPELVELVSALAAHGVERGGAPAILLALATGPERYAAELAADAGAWERFRVAFDALRSGRGVIATDPTTLGALAWIYLRGDAFTAQIREQIRSPTVH